MCGLSSRIPAPLQFKTFCTTQFNMPSYARAVLAHNFDDLIQFLEHASNTSDPYLYAHSALRMFSNKLKECPWINPSAFSTLLMQLPNALCQLEGYSEQTEADRIQETYDLLYQTLSLRFDTFKKAPRTFLRELSSQVTRSYTLFVTKKDNQLAFKSTLVRFLELAANKLVWSPEDALSTWQNVITISDRIESLKNKLWIDEQEVNDLYHSLLARYCYFIDIWHMDLSEEFYEQLIHTAQAGNFALLTCQEDEELIQTKRDMLVQTLLRAYSRKKSIPDTESLENIIEMDQLTVVKACDEQTTITS